MMDDYRRTYLVEQTDKKYKALQAAGGLVAVLGLIVFITALIVERQTAGIVGFVVLVIGVAIHFWGRSLAWWHHG
jgi:hypothetical protein